MIRTIDEEVATLLEFRAKLTGTPSLPLEAYIAAAPTAAAPKKKKVFSEHTKALMAEAQKKRWDARKAEAAKQSTAAKKPGSPGKKARTGAGAAASN